jgi:hypothetical protein
MIHNLLSIRQFTTDNSCSVEFDPSGLTVKDSVSGRPLLRYDSSGPLYNLRLPASTTLPGTAGLVTPVATLWLSSVIVHIFLALGFLMSISAMRASWVAMVAFLSLLLHM